MRDATHVSYPRLYEILIVSPPMLHRIIWLCWKLPLLSQVVVHVTWRSCYNFFFFWLLHLMILVLCTMVGRFHVSGKKAIDVGSWTSKIMIKRYKTFQRGRRACINIKCRARAGSNSRRWKVKYEIYHLCLFFFFFLIWIWGLCFGGWDIIYIRHSFGPMEQWLPN